MELGLDFSASKALFAWLASVLPVGEEQRHIFSVQIKSILNEEIKSPKQQAGQLSPWHRDQLSRQDRKTLNAGLPLRWSLWACENHNLEAKKMRGKLKRKTLSSHPKLSAISTKKRAAQMMMFCHSRILFPNKSNYTKCMFSLNYPSATTEG